MSFPRYPKYKASRVEWLGDVPEYWEVKRLKHNTRLLTQKTDRRDHPVGLENIEGWSGRFIPTETAFEGDGIAFDAGDVLFGKLRPYLAKAYLAKSSGEAVGDFHVIRPDVGMEGRFVQYQILNREFIAIVDGSTFGSKMPRASWEFVGGLKVTRPPLPEQTAIAEFLDRETGKIDELVAEQRRLMELLKEKRQAVISHAVTKGLNPQAPMKPSGIEWLGDVPAHWGIVSLRYVFDVKAGGDLKEEYFSKDKSADHLFPIYTNSVKPDEIYGFTSKRVFKSNTITVTGRGDIGFATYRDHEYDAIIRLLVLTPKRNEPCKYYALLINGVVKFLGGNTAVSQLSTEQISPYKVLFPPLLEREAIVAFLDMELAKFDTLTAEAQRAIDFLQERRTALISAAVTGQIDVRQLPKN